MMPKSLRLILLSLRDLLVSAGPVLALAVGLLMAAYWWLDPQPPTRVVLATGPADSAYANFGRRYAKALEADGIEVVEKRTDGSLDNLTLLRRGDVDVAFVRGGSADPAADEEAGLVSLGALFYEPLWIFVRKDAVPAAAASGQGAGALVQLKNLRVNVDKSGSGVPQLVDQLLRANHLDPATMKLSRLEPAPAAEALLGGMLDAVVLASAPQSRQVQQLLRAPDVLLMDVQQAEAYVRRFGYLQSVTLPRGVVDLAADLPPHDVTLLAATTSLLSREQTHPALRELFAKSAQSIHSAGGWFNRARDFPNTRTSELPVSPEGDRAINGTPPFWQRYLPFWASNLFERMWLVLGGLLVLMLPLSRVVPPLYQFRVRSRVFRWYARLRDIEQRGGAGDTPEPLLRELDELEARVNKVTVPLSYANELYELRAHIRAARLRLTAHAEVAP